MTPQLQEVRFIGADNILYLCHTFHPEIFQNHKLNYNLDKNNLLHLCSTDLVYGGRN